MSQLLPYEQIIAEKAGHAPLPNLADEIWASIDAGLGPIPPTGNEGGSAEPPAPPAGGSSFVTGLKLFLAAVATVTVIVVLQKKDDTNKNQQQPPIPAFPLPALPDDSSNKEDSFEETTNHQPGEKRNPSPATPRLTPDSQTRQPFIPPDPVVITDSSITAPQPQADPDKKDNSDKSVVKPADPPPPKKGKGVQGIKSTDYKIIPTKRDST